jgi:hypothetical protein
MGTKRQKLKNTKPTEIKGFNPMSGRFRREKDIEIVDLTTETEIKLPKDFAVPSYKRKG